MSSETPISNFLETCDKNLSKSPLRVTWLIDNFLLRYPNAKPKYVAEMLGLPYKKYAAMISTEKVKIRRYLGLGRSHGCHRLVWECWLGCGVVEVVAGVAVRGRVIGRWYVSGNRNGMLVFSDGRGSVRLYRNGRCRVEPKAVMGVKEVQDFLFDALWSAGVGYQAAEEAVGKLQTVSRHRVFPVGESVPPFKVEFYKPSLGLTFYSDYSHPFYVEATEEWPEWVKELLSVVNRQVLSIAVQSKNLEEFSKNFKTHIAAMKGITDATQELKSAVLHLVPNSEDEGSLQLRRRALDTCFLG